MQCRQIFPAIQYMLLYLPSPYYSILLQFVFCLMRDEYKAAKILCEKGEQNKTAVDSSLDDDDVMVGCS